MLDALLLTAALAAAPVRFEEAVEHALARHPALRVAQQDVARARALVEQARAPSLPTLGLSATYLRLDGDRSLQERVIAGKDQLTGNVSVVAPLVNTPRWAGWYRAQLGSDAAQVGAEEVRRTVAVGAARAWLAVLAQTRVVAAVTSARDVAQAHLTFAQQRRAGGVGTVLDEVRAAQEQAVSEAQLETALGQLARAEEALGVATGSDEPLGVQGEPPAPAEAVSAAPLEERLDVKAVKARRDAAGAAVKTAWMDYVPLLTAVFQPFFQNPPTLTQPLWGWQAQLVLSIPLYDGGLRYGQARERAAQAASAEAQLEGALRQAKSEVRAALAQVAHADKALVAARAAARQATDALELANLAWTQGATTNLEVIDAERRARDAQLQAVLAEDAARQARLDVLIASGRFP